MPFTFEKLAIPDVQLITPRCFPDNRGSFLESYKASDFAAAGIPGPFLQDNQSVSRRGVLRGLHFQKPPYAQAKLVRVLQGAIHDVVVDLRKDSPTFRHWLGIPLAANTRSSLYIPAGFAHGFVAMSETADVLYKTSTEYKPDSESGIRWDDPDLRIRWPITNPILSSKDAELPTLRQCRSVFA